MDYFPFSPSFLAGTWLGRAVEPSRMEPWKKPCKNAKNEPQKRVNEAGGYFPVAMGGHPALCCSMGICTLLAEPKSWHRGVLAAQINHEMPFRNKIQL